MLSLENVGFSYKNANPLFRNLSFVIQSGDLVQICGPNGAGKTSLLRCLAGQEHFSEGRILWQKKPSSALLPQITASQFHIDLTFEDILRCSLRSSYHPDFVLSLGLLESCELARTWNTASGGERQKLLLVKTLLADASLILLDEPLNHLDPARSQEWPLTMARFFQWYPKKAVVFVSHQDSSLANVRQIHLSKELQ